MAKVDFTRKIPIELRGFKAYRNGNQVIPSALWPDVQLNTEEFDDNNEFDTATFRATIKATGRYLICIQITFLDMIDGTDVETRVVRDLVAAPMFLMNRPGGNGYCAIAGSTVVNLTAGDVIRLQVYQNSGANRTLDGSAPQYNFMAVIRVK